MKAKLRNLVIAESIAVTVLMLIFREQTIITLVTYFYWVPLTWIAVPIVCVTWIAALGPHNGSVIDLKSTPLARSIWNFCFVYLVFTFALFVLIYGLTILLISMHIISLD